MTIIKYSQPINGIFQIQQVTLTKLHSSVAMNDILNLFTSYVQIVSIFVQSSERSNFDERNTLGSCGIIQCLLG